MAYRFGNVAELSRAQVDEVNAGEQSRRCAVEQALTAMPRCHHPRRAVQDGAEVVAVAQFGLASGNTHSHRQVQHPLSGDRGVDRQTRRGEYRAHPGAGPRPHPTAASSPRYR